MSGPPQPVPQGDYVPARRHGTLIFTSGMTPRRDGVLLHHGPVRADAPVDDYRDAVRLACGNALAAAHGMLAPGESLAAILSLTVYVAAEPGFAAHSRIADLASAYLREELGDAGIGSRAAVGVASLPGNAPVEIQLVAAT
ncbi:MULTISPECIES: RidA family protein [Paracoccus]|jgi:enamine deaminase RidA (YjgF/YER057c/UK114 family)|uniref:RidA family protein n=1 Tax=Paracoccus TaxID=265 RepID=UPI000CEC2775|nr:MULTISPECIES: RidA family protein [Paracoccus]